MRELLTYESFLLRRLNYVADESAAEAEAKLQAERLLVERIRQTKGILNGYVEFTATPFSETVRIRAEYDSELMNADQLRRFIAKTTEDWAAEYPRSYFSRT